MLKSLLSLVFAVLAVGAFASGSVAADFRLTSPDIQDGAVLADRHVLDGFGCQGGNVSPALAWSGAPAATRSFAVSVYDPDAPTGSGWWHWVVFNIPATVTSLPRAAGTTGQMPPGAVESRTDFGPPGYGGACPPKGAARHRYVFTVHALATEGLPLDTDASPAMVGFYVNAHSLARATLTATFGR